MMKKYLVLIMVSICLGSLSAQTFIKKVNLNTNGYSPKAKLSGQTLKILAVMVEFQTDQDAATEGNGKFGTIYSKDYGTDIIDPLPHDKGYFESHLEFVKNYFNKVSNGQLNISYTVLPVVFTASQRMRYYSTTSNNFTNLANFSKEIWAKVDSAYPDFDFSSYNLFTIFHAGVGKEVSLSGSINDSKDISSLYLTESIYKNIYGSSFQGFEVHNKLVTNTLVMPETESREETLVDGSVYLAQITINGLLASSIGNYLGLPDLYNTTSGVSAIGRFGLMDTQSIFAYNGVFPPEPSAWEKVFLGWVTPVTVAPGQYKINLVTQMAASASDTVILKVPINSSEYFLVENRQRDAKSDGSKLTYEINGNSYTQSFTKDQAGFNSIDIDSLRGVITDVDEYDWAIPGVIDDTAHYHGGILIWHIDENIINDKIASDKINADPSNRGVNLMEASGVPEIGQQFTNLLGDIVIGEGSYEDYWYSENTAKLFKNRFDADTRPSSNTNSGANSLISFSGFTSSANKMSFTVAYGDSLIKPLFSNKIQNVSSNNRLTALQNGGFCLLSGANLLTLDSKGDSTGIINNFSNYKAAVFNGTTSQYLFGAYDSTLNIFTANNSTTSPGTLSRINLGDGITTAPVAAYQSSVPRILVGTGKGQLKSYVIGSGTDTAVLDSTGNGYGVTNIAAYNDYYVFGNSFVSTHVSGSGSSSGNGYYIKDSQGYTYTGYSGQMLQIAVTNDNSGNKIIAALVSGNIIDVISKGKLVNEIKINSADTVKSFSLTDLKQDGNIYIVYNNGLKIDAVNMQGAEAANFPFTDPKNIGFTGLPLTADITGDGSSEIISATTDGRIFAINGVTGKAVSGFPISVGAGLAGAPVVFENNGIISLAAYSAQGNFYGWNIGSGAGKLFWSEENGSNANDGYVSAALSQNFTNTFFPAKKAYNYPNPVHSGETRIHYYVAEDAAIDIKIFDVAGDYVAHLTDNAHGGLEKETAWNVNSIQSGIYFASIKATGTSGKAETNVIKIAVIK